MRTADVEIGTVVLVKLQGGTKYVEGVVSNLASSLITLTVEDIGDLVVAGGDLNMLWKIQYEKGFVGVGYIEKGTKIRLGRKIGRAFIPGITTLFADGLKLIDGVYTVIGRNLNKGIKRELKISDYKKTWIII